MQPVEALDFVPVGSEQDGLLHPRLLLLLVFVEIAPCLDYGGNSERPHVHDALNPHL